MYVHYAPCGGYSHQYNAIAMSLDRYRAIIDHRTWYIFWKLCPNALTLEFFQTVFFQIVFFQTIYFKLCFSKLYFPNCIFQTVFLKLCFFHVDGDDDNNNGWIWQTDCVCRVLRRLCPWIDRRCESGRHRDSISQCKIWNIQCECKRQNTNTKYKYNRNWIRTVHIKCLTKGVISTTYCVMNHYWWMTIQSLRYKYNVNLN